jgi:hypothetical protein
MSVESKALADRVVTSFQELLDSDTRRVLGDTNLHSLNGMIREALAEQAAAVIERLQQDLRQIETEMVEKPPLEL